MSFHWTPSAPRLVSAAMAKRRTLGNRVAPLRFMAFLALLLVAGTLASMRLGFIRGSMVGFDVATLAFLVSCIPLFYSSPHQLRRAAAENDANRVLLVVISILLAAVVLGVLTAMLAERQTLDLIEKVLIVITLVLAWTFGNAIFTLHYAHLFYSGADGGRDSGGLRFPNTKEPVLADFIYFSYTLGVAVQTSDVEITQRRIRNVVTVHCVVGFFFNLGVLALTINVIGQS
jgi:uncharacterized membrane protein